MALTVTDLEAALPFFDSLLGFLGYRRGDVIDNASSQSRLVVYVNAESGGAINIWAAPPALKDHKFEIYAPGLHHVAFNATCREQVDELARAVPSWGGSLLEGPAEYPYEKGYYAVYFRGPDGIKFECVHMPNFKSTAM